PLTKAKFIKINLTLYVFVYTTAAMVTSTITAINVLVNNTSIIGTKFSLTPEGVKSQFSANHICRHFLLTNLLILKLKVASTGSRIINIFNLLYQFNLI
ncbi:hypothetical protein DL95DRAFT_311688, partial [Leptodontidium sp. 2 PMI_412]